ncbi:hypothetical protein C8R47DRAFT_1162453 [Mycena vitilis]|nr:hypothetical protein C8R47DRAFT_1162453 [Mycena vitilis]
MDAVVAWHHCDPRLPPELERMIFEVAALARWTEIPRLVRVAWRVKKWIQPLLYRIVLLTSHWTSHQAEMSGFPIVPIGTMVDAVCEQSTPFLDSAVHHLFFDYAREEHLPISTMNIILTRCRHVARLFTFDTPDLEHLNSLHCLRRLTLDTSSGFPHVTGAFTQPLFRNVTHLELLNDWDGGDSDASSRFWTDVGLLPHLTHLAFNSLMESPTFHPGLRANTRLQCFAFLHRSANILDAVVLSDDERFVCIQQTDWRLDWLRGANGEDDFWVLADEFIAAKRTGKIDRSLFSINDADHWWRN